MTAVTTYPAAMAARLLEGSLRVRLLVPANHPDYGATFHAVPAYTRPGDVRPTVQLRESDGRQVARYAGSVFGPGEYEVLE